MKKSDFMIPRVTPETKMAKKLAKAYKTQLKSENIFGRPWDPHVPLEAQSVFPHFVKAAKIVIEEEGDPAVFIKAQFDGLRWTKKFPFPTQLSTPGARLRFMELRQRLESKESKRVTEDDFLIEDYVHEQRKLDRICARLNLKPRQVLKQLKDDFTPGFLALHKRKAS